MLYHPGRYANADTIHICIDITSPEEMNTRRSSASADIHSVLMIWYKFLSLLVNAIKLLSGKFLPKQKQKQRPKWNYVEEEEEEEGK